MVENKEYSPTPVEWDELVVLWNRSRVIFANTISTGIKARLAWTTKNFVESHSDIPHRMVYAWLERNLEISKNSMSSDSKLLETRWNDVPTAVYRLPKGASNSDVVTSSGDLYEASDSGVHRLK